MKITDILVHPMGMPAERVRWTAQEIMRRVELTLVEVRTDAGIVGVGEISTGPQSAVCKLLDDMAPVIKGMDPLAIDAVWSKLFSITVPRPGGLGGWDGLPPPLARNQRPQFMAAMAGIDIALVGHRGQGREQAGVPPAGRHAHRRASPTPSAGSTTRAHRCSPAPTNWPATSPRGSAR